MIGLTGVIALLAILGLSLIITRLATIALTMTGVSENIARFQARSTFTGTGFTTEESEQMTSHPVRRRIIMLLMVLRSAGLVTIILTLILSFIEEPGHFSRVYRLLIIIVGIFILWILSSRPSINRLISKLFAQILEKWTDLDVRDYASLLNLSGNYGVMEIRVRNGDWLENKHVRHCRLPDEGVTILGIDREDGTYVGVPRGDTEIYAGDTLVMYGKTEGLKELDQRRAGGEGDQAHAQAMADQTGRMAEQDKREEESRRKREDHVSRDTAERGKPVN